MCLYGFDYTLSAFIVERKARSIYNSHIPPLVNPITGKDNLKVQEDNYG